MKDIPSSSLAESYCDVQRGRNLCFSCCSGSNLCLVGTAAIQLSWLWHPTQPPTHLWRGMYGAALLQFGVLVWCVKIYSINMEIFPCRRYNLLLSRVPCRKHCSVSTLNFEVFSLWKDSTLPLQPLGHVSHCPLSGYPRGTKNVAPGYQVSAESARSCVFDARL